MNSRLLAIALCVAMLFIAGVACATFRAPGDPAPTRPPTETRALTPSPEPTASPTPTLTITGTLTSTPGATHTQTVRPKASPRLHTSTPTNTPPFPR